MSVEFPNAITLWRGAILGGIVSAIDYARSSQFSTFYGWRRNHYIINGGDGRDGIITFAGGHWLPAAPLVGVFHDIHSEKFVIRNEIELERFFVGCPAYQRSLAEQEALHYLRLRYDGVLLHRATAVFWDHDGLVASVDSWSTLLLNGASLIENESFDNTEEALRRFQVDHGTSDEQTRFARNLFERKIARPAARVWLSAEEVEWLKSIALEPKTTEVARDAFREIGIYFPDELK